MESPRNSAESVIELFKLLKRGDTYAKNQARVFYRMLLKFFAIMTGLLAVAIWFNVNNYMGVNAYLAFGMILLGVCTFTHPNILITLFNADLITKAIPKKFQETPENGITGLFLRMARRTVAAFCLTFLFLTKVPIKGNVELFLTGLVIAIVLIMLNVEGKKKGGK